MNADSLVNAFVDFANGDISKEVADSRIETELGRSSDLNENDIKELKVLVETYSSSGDISSFIAKVSEIVGKVPEVAGWAAETKK